jgi:hypothetical protein
LATGETNPSLRGAYKTDFEEFEKSSFGAAPGRQFFSRNADGIVENALFFIELNRFAERCRTRSPAAESTEQGASRRGPGARAGRRILEEKKRV